MENIILIDAILIVVWIANHFMVRAISNFVCDEYDKFLNEMKVEEIIPSKQNTTRLVLRIIHWSILVLAICGVFGPYTISIPAIWIGIEAAIMLFGLAYILHLKWILKDEKRKEDYARRCFAHSKDFKMREV